MTRGRGSNQYQTRPGGAAPTLSPADREAVASSVSDADDEVAGVEWAFTKPEWSAAGFGPDDADEVATWVAEGVSPTDAAQWRGLVAADEAGPWIREQFTPTEAAAWREAGIPDALDACAWKDNMFDDPTEAGAWANVGLDRDTARKWDDEQLTPADYTRAEQAGLEWPYQVVALRDTGQW